MAKFLQWKCFLRHKKKTFHSEVKNVCSLYKRHDFQQYLFLIKIGQESDNLMNFKSFSSQSKCFDSNNKRESFIPLSRRSLVRLLLQNDNLSDKFHSEKFEVLALSFHSLLTNHYHVYYQEIKELFNVLNSDKDTLYDKECTLHERLDREFWLIKKLSFVLKKANFLELPSHAITECTNPHVSKEGIKVTVDSRKYAVLKVWVLGEDIPPVKFPWYQPILIYILQIRFPEFLEKHKHKLKPQMPLKFYKRVITAVRLRTDDKVTLKLFRDVPINAIEKLLPEGRMEMRTWHNYVASLSLYLSAIGVLSEFVARQAGANISWPLTVSGISVFVAVLMHVSFYKKVATFLTDTSRVLYFKNISSNWTLLHHVVQRAKDELFKEMLLTYIFLLWSAEKSLPSLPGKMKSNTIAGNISSVMLEKTIEDWVFHTVGVEVYFCSSEAVHQLRKLGLVHIVDGFLQALPLEVSLSKLPEIPNSVAVHTLEDDLIEGYDKCLHLDNLACQEKRRYRYGWKPSKIF